MYILLVDDDSQYRAALVSLLEPLGHTILEAGDGLEAQEVLRTKQVDLLVSDIRMPKCDGVKLLRWTKANKPIPVILMTGFAEILESTQASELGADGFLPKPFKFDEIKTMIEAMLSGNYEKAPPIDLDDQYCKIPVEDFVSGSQINFSIFHRLTKFKYIKIAHRGEDIESSRISKYKSKGMRSLFLVKEDFARYVGFNLNLAKRIDGTNIVSTEKKRNFMRYTAELVLEQLFVEGADKASYETAADFVETTIKIIQDQKEAFTLLETLNNHADFLYAHCLGVSLYSVMLARELSWTWGPTLFKISMAGLFHDIGFKEISRAILEKPRLALTQEERSLYETHPVRGMELLNQIPNTSEDVILIAFQHHEDCLSKGYPQKLPKQRTHPLARLIGVVDTFCEHTIASPGMTKYTAHDAIKLMLARDNVFDREYMSALMRSFKFEDTKINSPSSNIS